jgi:hypothetical protein
MRLSTMIALVPLLALGACKQEQGAVADREEDVAETATRAPDEERATADDRAPGETSPQSDEEMIDNAESAAPEAVSKDATIIAMEADGTMRTLRAGSSAFTCIPNNPNSPGNDPMCLDKNGLEWAQAWMSKGDPPAGKVGFGYMLQGGSDASNTDPYAQTPAEGEDWIDTGPHVMIFNAPSLLDDYPKQAGDPSRPYVMWPETKYAHVMVPVR